MGPKCITITTESLCFLSHADVDPTHVILLCTNQMNNWIFLQGGKNEELCGLCCLVTHAVRNSSESFIPHHPRCCLNSTTHLGTQLEYVLFAVHMRLEKSLWIFLFFFWGMDQHHLSSSLEPHKWVEMESAWIIFFWPRQENHWQGIHSEGHALLTWHLRKKPGYRAQWPLEFELCCMYKASFSILVWKWCFNHLNKLPWTQCSFLPRSWLFLSLHLCCFVLGGGGFLRIKLFRLLELKDIYWWSFITMCTPQQLTMTHRRRLLLVFIWTKRFVIIVYVYPFPSLLHADQHLHISAIS